MPSWPAPSTQKPSVRVTYTFRDAEGKESTIKVYFALTSVQSNWDNVGSSIQTYTGAQLVKYTAAQEFGFLETLPTAVEYDNIEDKAQVVFVNVNNGDSLKWQIPAPLVADFESDGETFLAATGVDLTDVMNAQDVTDEDGGLAVWAYLRGYLRRAKARRKFAPGWPTESGGD